MRQLVALLKSVLVQRRDHARRRRCNRPSFEILEDRCLLATWTGNVSDAWNERLNWDTMEVPGSNEPVFIKPVAGKPAPEITVPANAFSVQIDNGGDLVLKSNLSVLTGVSIDGGVTIDADGLQAPGGVQIDGFLSMDGGNVEADVSNDGNLAMQNFAKITGKVVNDGVLYDDSVGANGEIDTITGNLTNNEIITLRQLGTLRVEGNYSDTPSAEIRTTLDNQRIGTVNVTGNASISGPLKVEVQKER